MLIQDKDVRAAIGAAEQGVAEGDLIAAVEQLSIAFELAREGFRLDQPFQPLSYRSVGRHEVSRVIRDIEDGLRKSSSRPSFIVGFRKLEQILQTLVRRSERAEDRLEALTLGAQASDHAWFRRRFPQAHGYIGSDDWSVVWTEHPADVRMTHDEVIRGLEFVTTVALHWQQFPLAPDPEAGERE